MLISHGVNALGKPAMLVCCMLMSLAELGVAGPRDGVDNTKSQDEAPASLLEEATPEYMPQRLDGVSAEDRMRLRMDLRQFNRAADPAHEQIEDRRRLMHRKLQERFFAADQDNDGQLSRVETVESLPQVARHFNQVDLNGDGFISINELVAFQAKLMERQRAAELKIREAQEAEMKKAEDAAIEEKQAKQTPPSKTKGKQAEANRKPAL